MSVFEPPHAPASKPQRQPSFVGLPPISPGPEFGSALGISAADLGHALRSVSPPGHLQGPSPQGIYLNRGSNRTTNTNASASASANGGINGGGSNGGYPGPVPGPSPNYKLQSSSPPPQATQLMQGPYVMMQSPHVQHPAGQQFPPAAHQLDHHVNGNGQGNGSLMYQQSGPPQPTSHGHHGQALQGPVSYQQFQSSSPPPPGMPSPPPRSNGHFVVPPGWKIEQSQLQHPLSSPRHRHSPSISSLKQQNQQNQSYEIDKETGALSTRSVSPPTHSPVNSRRPGQPALVSSAAPPTQDAHFRPPNAPFMQLSKGAALARTSTNVTQNSQFHDEPEGRRNSNVFSTIRNRLTGNGNDQRDIGGDRTHANGITGDGVSDASIPVDEQGKRGPSNFFGLRGNGQPNGESAPYPSQDLGGAPLGQTKEKRPFFSRPSGLGNGSSTQGVSRPATAESIMGPPVVGSVPGQPKKRFSKLTGILNRDKPENQLSQAQPYDTVQAQRPSFQGGVKLTDQNGPPGGTVDDGQLSAYGRPRSSTAGSRPSIFGHERTRSAQCYGPPTAVGAAADEERGRKPSGGTLLSSIFGKRSDSKNREHAAQRPPRSPPGLDQPQSLNPQGQIMTVQRPGQPGLFLPVQGQPLTMQGQPVIPPQGQYSRLAQQAQQSQQQQYLSHSGMQGISNGQDLMQRQFGAHPGLNQQRQPSPGISPVTQSSASPLVTTQPQGRPGAHRQQSMQQESPLSSPKEGQGQQQLLGNAQVATAVPIRQVGSSPNGNSGHFQDGNSPDGQSDPSRQRSSSMVNQIDVGGARKPSIDIQGTRNRAASHSLPQQHPVHIASLHTQVRKLVNSTSPRSSAQLLSQDASGYSAHKQEGQATVSSGQPNNTPFPSHTRSVSQDLMPGHPSHGQDQQHAVSVQSTPSVSPVPNPAQQAAPPGSTQTQTQSWQNSGGQGQSAPTGQQSSLYRPSGPQIAAVVQSFSQQQPQSPWSIGRQNGFGQSAQSRQQFQDQSGQQLPAGPPPQGMMRAPLSIEQRTGKEGTFSKFLKSGKTFVHQISDSQPPDDKSKSEKESKGMKSMMGVFKRPKDSKQPEVGKSPPGGPQWAIQSGQVRPSTQQYGSNQDSQGQQVPRRLPQMQMPPKAQQVMGIGEGEQKIPVDPQPDQTPQAQAPGQSSPEPQRTQQQRLDSQPHPDHHHERPLQTRTSPPLEQQQVYAPQPHPQPPSGRPSMSEPETLQAPGEMPPQQQQQQQQQQNNQNYDQQQQRRPSQPPIGQTQSQLPAATTSAMRAHNLKQQVAQHAPEPQYAPVPIPHGYATVHGESTAAQKPDMVVPPGYGQPQAHTQQWVYPGIAPVQMPAGVPPHMVQQGWPQYPPYQESACPMIMAQHPLASQQYMQGQQTVPSPPLQQPPPQTQMTQTIPQSVVHPYFMASAPIQLQSAQQQTSSPSQHARFTPLPQAAYAPTDGGPAMADNGQQDAGPQVQQGLSAKDEESPIVPVQTDNGGQTQIHQPEAMKPLSTPASFQAVPRSAFAVVKPQQGQDQLQPPQASGGNLVPQRQTSGASEVSCLTSVSATNQGRSGLQSGDTTSPERSAISPEPAYERPPVTLTDGPPMIEQPVPSAAANQDDIYGATPSHSAHASPVRPNEHQSAVDHATEHKPAQEPLSEPEAKFAGPLPNRSPESRHAVQAERSPSQQGYVVDAPAVIVEPATATTPSAPEFSPGTAASKTTSPGEEEPPSPTESERGRKAEWGSNNNKKNRGWAGSGKPVQTSQEIFEEHKRKQLVRDMEEKIALNPTEPDGMMTLDPGSGRKKGEEAPLMSATSYPGQEWNPYGDAWIEDDL